MRFLGTKPRNHETTKRICAFVFVFSWLLVCSGGPMCFRPRPTRGSAPDCKTFLANGADHEGRGGHPGCSGRAAAGARVAGSLLNQLHADPGRKEEKPAVLGGSAAS